MNKNLRQAKAVAGDIEIPSSFRDLLTIALPALFAEGPTSITPVPRCQATEALIAFLGRHFNAVSREGAAVTLQGLGGFNAAAIPAEIDAVHFLDGFEHLTPLLMNRGGKISVSRDLVPKRFRTALKKLDAAGFILTRSETDTRFTLEVTPSSPESLEIELDNGDEAVKAICLFAALAAATGQNRLIESVPLSGGLEAVLKKLGADITVLREGQTLDEAEVAEAEPEGELEKRIRRMQAKKDTGQGKPLKFVTLKSPTALKGAAFELSGDPLLAAPFLLAATLIGDSKITVKGITGSATGGLFNALRRMGASMKSERLKNRDAFDCTAESAKLTGRRLSGELTASINDLFPFVALAAAYASGQTLIRDAAYLHDGPVDIIQGTIANLKAMGAKVGEIEDGLVIEGAREYDGAEFNSFGSPAIAMAFAAAALKNKGESVIKNAEAVDYLWPDFYFKLESLVKTA